MFVDPLFADVVDRVRRNTDIEHVVLIGDGDVPHDIGYEELLAAGTTDTPPEPDETDPVILMYTGGTTGLPKGVLLDQRAEMLNLYHVAVAVTLDEDRVYLHQTPMFHAARWAVCSACPRAGECRCSCRTSSRPRCLPRSSSTA